MVSYMLYIVEKIHLGNDVSNIYEDVVNDACRKILLDLQHTQKNDKYNRVFNYDPKNDLEGHQGYPSILERIQMKSSIQLLRDIHEMRWYEASKDDEWIIIY